MWSAAARQINYGLSPEMGMLGLRDVFVVTPASSFNPNDHNHPPHETINSDHHSLNSSIPATALGVGVGVFPLLTAAHVSPHGLVGEDQVGLVGRSREGAQLWQNPQVNHGHYLKKQAPSCLALSGGGNYGGASVSELTPSSALTCQDCGNQAKKDCSHRRCRTCCRSRGFDCSTHVKSTWVPATRRRERQSMTIGASPAAASSASTSGAKKPRLITSQTTTTSHTSTSNTTKSVDTSSTQHDVSFKEPFPGQVRAPAVFKCVRVTAVEDGEDEYAYQAVVKIGGHVFKGFLYDQGVVESRYGFHNKSELHLSSKRSVGAAGDITESGEGGGRSKASAPVLNHPFVVYAASGGGGLLGGSSYG